MVVGGLLKKSAEGRFANIESELKNPYKNLVLTTQRIHNPLEILPET